MKKIKSDKNPYSRMILLLIVGFVFILLYSCSQGDFTKKSHLKSAIYSDKQDIRNIAYELKINNETLKSDQAKLQHLLKKEQAQISTTKISTTK